MQRASFPSLFRIVSWCVGYPFVLRGDSAVHPLSWIQLVSLCTFWIILAWDRQLQWQAKRPWRASPSHKQSINHTTTLLISFFCSEVEISCYIVDAFQVAFPRKANPINPTIFSYLAQYRTAILESRKVVMAARLLIFSCLT